MANQGPERPSHRNAILLAIGAFAAVVLAGLYFQVGAPTLFDLARVFKGSAGITPGFVGIADFGHWRLICVPGPPPLTELMATAHPHPSGGALANACRINGEMPAPHPSVPSGAAAEAVTSQTVLVAANFSMVGPMKRPALMLRLPPTARAGDVVDLRLDGDYEVRTAVRGCTPQQCLAAGALSDADWTHLGLAKALQLSFPTAGRQGVLVDLPVDGLAEAVGALARAQTQPRL